MPNVIASELSDKLKKLKANTKPIIFLGGECKDNSWREELKKRYGDHFYLLDPYDKDWSPESNIYDEAKGMLVSRFIIFYNGGKQTKLEKNFLKEICDPKRIKEFDSVSEIRKFFNDLLKYESIADKVRKLAGEMEKQAYPSVTTVYGKDVDLYFEHLDQDARNKVIKDLIDEKGDPKDIEIKLPDFPVPNKRGLDVPFIRGVDLQKNNLPFLRKLIGITPHGNPNVSMDYDPILHKYYQVEPEPVLHGDPVPQVQYDIHGKAPEIHEPSYALKTAKTGIVYSKGCAMVPTPEDLAKSVMDYGKANIPDSELHTEKEDQGREDDIHITLFYGFTEDNIEKLSEIFKGVKPFTVRLGLVNAFKDKKDYDVLKISVESPELEKLHYQLEKEMKNDNKYPTYAPHMTVAYVKKGKADKVIGDDKFRGKEFKVGHIVYSGIDNVRTSIKIG